MVLKYWFGQWRHPRYLTSGVIHILIFAGFLISSETFRELRVPFTGRRIGGTRLEDEPPEPSPGKAR